MYPKKNATTSSLPFILAVCVTFTCCFSVLAGQARADTETVRPTSYTDYAGKATFPNLAIDDNLSSYTKIATDVDAHPSIVYHSWEPSAYTYTSLTLTVELSAEGHVDDTWSISYSMDGGATWSPLNGAAGGDFSASGVSVLLSPNQELSLLQLKIESEKIKGTDGGELRVYDIRTEGTYEAPSTPSSAFEQLAYRFFESIQPQDIYEITSGVGGVDEATAITVDGEAMYVAGFEPGGWRVEMRYLADGDLIHTARNSGGGEPHAAAVAGGALYVVGEDYVDGNYGWRIEKYSTADLSLDTNFGEGGVVRSNPSDYNDTAYALAINGGSLYVVGSDRSNGAEDAQWRIEKRDPATGALLELVINNPSPADDIPLAAMVDNMSENLYLAGFDSADGLTLRGKKKVLESNAQWRIEKRPINNLSDVTALATENPTPNFDCVKTIAVDGSYLYTAGVQEQGFFDMAWRIEKRSLEDLALNGLFGSGGVVTVDPGYDDQPEGIAIDGTYMYVAGFSADIGGGGDTAWRIEKRDLGTGELVNAITNDFDSENNDRAYGIAYESGFIYLAGYEQPYLADWRIEKRDVVFGFLPPLVDDQSSPIEQNEPILVSPDQDFRMRVLLHVHSEAGLPLNGEQFKLQVAELSAERSCSDFDNFTDVSSSTGLIFNDILGADGEAAFQTEEDPSHDLNDSNHLTRYQTYEEENPFTNSVSEIGGGEDGLWDFSLKAVPRGSYCLRIVKDNGSAEEISYTIYPQVTVE